MTCPQARELFRVALLDPARGAIEVTVADLRSDRAQLEFTRPRTPVCGLGDIVDLRFIEKVVGVAFVVAARTTARTEIAKGRRYEFEFVDSRAFWLALSADARTVFNQRGALRVRPLATAPIAVVLRTGASGGGLRASVEDISVTGVGIVVRGRSESDLAEVERIELVLELPGASRKLAVAGRIRHRSVRADGLFYGITFEASRTRDFRQVEAEIGRHVMDIQRHRLLAAVPRDR